MLLLCAVGHFGFIMACYFKSFYGALLSRILFGLGQGSTVVAQGRITASWFVGKEISFAVALTESTHNLANFIAFVFVVPVSHRFGGYISSLWMALGFAIMSLLAGVIFYAVNKDAIPSSQQIHASKPPHIHRPGTLPSVKSGAAAATEESSLLTEARLREHNEKTYASINKTSGDVEEGYASPCSSAGEQSEGEVSNPEKTHHSWNPLAGLSIGFAVLCILHMIFASCYHLFAYVSASLIYQRYHTTVAHAGWMAGLTSGIAIFLCPVAGILMDYIGYKLWILLVCGGLTSCAYLLFLWSIPTPIPSLIILAFCMSFTPTILKSSVPNLVLPAVYG
jgi:MFS family permease